MSVDSFFFVRDEKLPTIPQWQAALDRAGVGIVLEASTPGTCPQHIAVIRPASSGSMGRSLRTSAAIRLVASMGVSMLSIA